MVSGDDSSRAVVSLPEFSRGDLQPGYGFVAALLVWGGFAVGVVEPSSLTRFEANAIYLACGVAVFAAAVAALLYRPGRLPITLFVASPLAVVAVSLPPVVALLLWGTYPAVSVSSLPHVVASIERSLLDPVGLARPFANTFHREGVGYLISWLLYSVPLGWLLGSAVLQLRFLAGRDP